MCCCGKPTINGQLGYKWQPKDAPGVYPVNPPNLGEDDTLLFDEPGRCGELDSHSFHFRVVRAYGQVALLVRHGIGEERFNLHRMPQFVETLAALDTNARYWLLAMMYHACTDAAREASQKTAREFKQAFVDGRLKKRKKRGQDVYNVTIA